MAAPMKSPDEKSVVDSENTGCRCIDHCQILPKARKNKPITINASAFFDLINFKNLPKPGEECRLEKRSENLMHKVPLRLPAETFTASLARRMRVLVQMCLPILTGRESEQKDVVDNNDNPGKN